MAYTSVSTGAVIEAAHVTELQESLNGASGAGQAMAFTQLNDSGNYALDVRNLDTGYGYGVRIRDAANATIALFAKAAVTIGKKIVVTLGTLTAAADALSITATWNNAAAAFNGIKVNITNTASDAASRLLDLQVAAASKFSVDVSGNTVIAGTAYIGDTANAYATLGLTINQGAADDEAFAAKSSDVAHGATGITETDTYFFLKKGHATNGGASLLGISDNAQYGIFLNGYAPTPDTGAGTSTIAPVCTYAASYSGTAVADLPVNGAGFTVRVRRGGVDATVFVVDVDGDTFQDGTAGTVYDEHDDALALWDMSYALHKDPKEQAKVAHYNLERLQTMGIVNVGEDGRAFVSSKKQAQLIRGAMGQMYQRMQQMESELRELKGKIK
jgi:hypothetical protein